MILLTILLTILLMILLMILLTIPYPSLLLYLAPS